jgi:hypothetical protein
MVMAMRTMNVAMFNFLRDCGTYIQHLQLEL